MSTYRNINRLLTVFTLAALILVTSAIPGATSTPGPTATREPQYKILFVGNSLTYWNNGLDHHIAYLAGSANPPLVIQADSIVLPWAPLKRMWEYTDAREMIGEGTLNMLDQRFPKEKKSLEEIFLKALEK